MTGRGHTPQQGSRCIECGAYVAGPGAYHPFLYCELFRLGHHEPEKYLALYGFTRAAVVSRADRHDTNT